MELTSFRTNVFFIARNNQRWKHIKWKEKLFLSLECAKEDIQWFDKKKGLKEFHPSCCPSKHFIFIEISKSTFVNILQVFVWWYDSMLLHLMPLCAQRWRQTFVFVSFMFIIEKAFVAFYSYEIFAQIFTVLHCI